MRPIQENFKTKKVKSSNSTLNFNNNSSYKQKKNEKIESSNLSSSEKDEDKNEISNIIYRIISPFESCPKPNDLEEGSLSEDDESSLDNLKKKHLGKTRHFIEESLKENVCLVCIETIFKQDSVWNCSNCFSMLHLDCIQQWIREGSYQDTYSPLSPQHFPNKKTSWFCPKCRKSYETSEIPKVYFCFCLKTKDPLPDDWLLPHSCSLSCQKPLSPPCGHNCLLSCHPGPCPPCPKTVSTSCFCGKNPKKMRRCGSSGWSCGKVCGKVLNCGIHLCNSLCHHGNCGDCEEKDLVKCLCGKSKEKKSCGQKNWKCQEICNKELDCGIHRCLLPCHPPPCSGCIRVCPCGKTRYENDCRKERPVCLETCGKVLECGIHKCPELCHLGSCNKCKTMVRKKCRCGKKEREIWCSKEWLCESKCPLLKDCQVHLCKKKCCDAKCPPCSLQCNKQLSCKQHKCQQNCHSGSCFPCLLTSLVTCNCGRTKVEVPCGAEKKTKPPHCSLPCLKPPDCHHKTRLPHHCHYGNCPKCTQVCGKIFSKCGHLCPSPCHSRVEVKVKEEEKVVPWEIPKLVGKTKMVTLDCPPCQQLVQVTCFGKHETITVACSDSRSMSCHQRCGRVLSCGNHHCQFECHVVKGDPGENMAGKNCEKCTKGCEKKRPSGCVHPCILPCHHGDCPECKQMIKMRCHCQMVVLHVSCHQWVGEDLHGNHLEEKKFEERLEKLRETLKSCKSHCPKMLACGHQCSFFCHQGNCSEEINCIDKVKIWCACGRKKGSFPCNVVKKKKSEGIPLVHCDEVCDQIKEKLKKKKEEEEKLKQEEDAEKRKKEVEAFEREMKGVRRRRQRKLSTNHVEESGFGNKLFLLIGTTILFLSVLVYWLFYF